MADVILEHQYTKVWLNHSISFSVLLQPFVWFLDATTLNAIVGPSEPPHDTWDNATAANLAVDCHDSSLTFLASLYWRRPHFSPRVRPHHEHLLPCRATIVVTHPPPSLPLFHPSTVCVDIVISSNDDAQSLGGCWNRRPASTGPYWTLLPRSITAEDVELVVGGVNKASKDEHKPLV